MAHRSAHEGLADVLARLSADDPAARDQIAGLATPYLKRLASRHGGFLPVDLREDVVQEALFILLRTRATNFNPKLGSPVIYLDMVAQRAARDVGATYTPPGSRTRVPKADKQGARPARRLVLALHDLPNELEPDAVGAESVAEIKCDVAAVLKAAPPLVDMALEMIYLDDIPVHEVATMLGLSRFQLSRRIDRFATAFVACA